MKVQRAVLPETNRHTWLVLADDYLPVPPIQAFLSYLAAIERSPNTLRSYAYSLKLFWEYLADAKREWTCVDLDALADFIHWLRDLPLSIATLRPDQELGPPRCERTVNTALAAVTMFYDYHWRAQQVKDIPLYRYQFSPQRRYKNFLYHLSKRKPTKRRALKLTEPRRSPRILDREQAKMLIAACSHQRDRFLVSLLYETGMRIGSALGLRHQDIKSWDNTIWIVPRHCSPDWARTKSLEPYPVHVSTELIALYADYLIHEFLDLDSDYVFINIWRPPIGRPLTYSAVADLFRRLSKRAGISVHPHMLRHTHATELLRQGVDVAFVQKRLGHSSIQSTQVYLHLLDDDLRQAIADYQDKRKGEDQ